MVNDQSDIHIKPQKKTRKRLLKMVAVLFVLGLVGSGSFLYWLINSPSSGTGMTVASSRAPSPPPKYTIATLDGKYFSIKYPNEFSVAPLNKPTVPIVENHSLVKHQLSPWDLEIQIELLPSGNLNDDSSYHLRKVKSEIYTEKVFNVGALQLHQMTDSSAPEINETEFFTHNGLLALVTLSGGTSRDKEAMQADLTSMLTSWKWL